MDQHKPVAVAIKWGRPSSFGWVRAPSFDDTRFMAYERPDGVIARAPRDRNFICCKVGKAPAIVKELRQSEN